MEEVTGCRVARGAPEISHMFLADDSLFFFKATDAQATRIHSILSIYATASGQYINLNKSTVCFSPNTSPLLRASICAQLGITETEELGRYLGLLASLGRNKREALRYIKEKTWKRLHSWKNKLLTQAGRQDIRKVADLIKDGVWDWQTIDSIFEVRDRRLIQAIPLSHSAQVDKLIWARDRSGLYSVKSAYRMLTWDESVVNDSTHNSSKSVWRKLWRVHTTPTIRNLIWRAANNILPVLDNLARKEMPIQNTCPLCQSSEETVLHLFVSCSFARQTRNDRVWRGRNSAPIGTWLKAKAHFEEWWSLAPPIAGTPEGATGSSWSRPRDGFVKVNIDASTGLIDDMMGVGFIARNELGVFLAAKNTSFRGSYGPREAEAVAVKEALSWIKSKGWMQVEIEIDCKEVVDALNNPSDDWSYFSSIITDGLLIVKQQAITSTNPRKEQFAMSDLSSSLPAAAAAALSAEDRDDLVNVLKNKLQSLAVRESDMLKNLTPSVRKHVEALKQIQNQHNELEAKFFEGRAALETKYQKLYEPLYTKRYEIVNGIVEVEGVSEVSGDRGDDKGTEEKGVPNFWLNAMKMNEILTEEITERDEEALKYLKDIKWSRLDGTKGFKLEFFFDTNPFFKNTVLVKTYYMHDDDELILEKAIGTDIEWHPSKCLTQKVLKKKPKKGSKSAKPITKTEKCASFFNFFNPPAVPDDDDEEEEEEDQAEELHEQLEQDYEIGSTIRDKIIPHAVSWFTGEAVELDEFQDTEEEDDECDEDDDEDDDEDSDDE
ncbi:unnamed protein product [Cuscuta campestris]|uniref:Reverse transcriptase zinc-binding domain-containing protein n=1 Tax=Cuscuta campestris TaxID=132261 RepID=A0A484KNW8_9ASTE|nr:unnamed protein product [Cuscuta campestris]